MKQGKKTIQEMLYEPPGPKAKKTIIVVTVLSLGALAVLIGLIIRRFYVMGQLDSRYWFFFAKLSTWRFLGEGLLGTIEAAAASGVLAFAAGFLLLLARICRFRILNAVSIAIIEFTRGVPTLLFIYFFFLVAPQLGIKLPVFWKITIPVSLSACGIVAEVLRSGVNAVPKGQKEAALCLGMTDWRVFNQIVFPQALRYVIPSLISELVIVVKDTTFAYVVNFPDLMQDAKVLISNYDALLSVYLVVAVIYILINYLLNRISAYTAGKRSFDAGTRTQTD